MFWSDLSEERSVNRDILDRPGRSLHTEVIPLEELAKTVAVDEVDRRSAVPGCLLLGVSRERAGSDEQSFIAPACHRAAEVAHRAGSYAAAISLALEEDREADQSQPVNAESVDAAIAALPRDTDTIEVSLAQ